MLKEIQYGVLGKISLCHRHSEVTDKDITSLLIDASKSAPDQNLLQIRTKAAEVLLTIKHNLVIVRKSYVSALVDEIRIIINKYQRFVTQFHARVENCLPEQNAATRYVPRGEMGSESVSRMLQALNRLSQIVMLPAPLVFRLTHINDLSNRPSIEEKVL